jgi:hypothetical protein
MKSSNSIDLVGDDLQYVSDLCIYRQQDIAL